MGIVDILNRLLGDPSQRELKKLWPVVPRIREFQKSAPYQALTLDDLPGRTQLLRDRVVAGETIDQILPEAFALVCRACELLQGKTMQIGRQTFTWDMVPFDVQLVGGMVLHRGCIAEMRTGEGKTLVCTLPAYLNALAGKGVHVVTVNDYLAKRDATWMGLLYQALGLKVGIIVHGLNNDERRTAYAADITYGTNNEFGFDYLRDNMAVSITQQVQRGLHYAIVDEVDSILVDEARTPLIISQPAAESTAKYAQYARIVVGLQEKTHFTRDEKQRAAMLTEEGIAALEKSMGVDNIYTEKGFEEVHHIEQALRAHAIYKRDVDYVVKDGEVVIVDEFTGRLMPGRRYSNGLHQAIEAKEGVDVQRESRTLATITFQNYFRLFSKLAGMTGTAKTEEEEFESIYKLKVIVIPTHRPMVRDDQPDAVYRTVKAKFIAAAKLAKEKYERGQPVLIGTTSIEKSEAMSALLTDMAVPHQVLNAKHHEKEAEIVAQAGQRGAITIATNMAGRGTDIKLGTGVSDLGGLVIIGTERHEARRIDNQLRGRSGRQGDPGASQFFVSMEDDLMRLFGGERLKALMERLNVPDDVPLQNGMVSRSIEGAQKRVEGHNFDIRRHVLQYDDVMNKHRDIVYKRRQKILEKLAQAESDASTGADAWALHQDVLRSIESEVNALVAGACAGDDPDGWELDRLVRELNGLSPGVLQGEPAAQVRALRDRDALEERLRATLLQAYEAKCAANEPLTVLQAERVITLRSIDTHWMDHIDDMSHLREQVAFSGFAQRDPLIEYQDQGFQRFRALIARIDGAIVRALLQLDFRQFAPRQVLEEAEEELEGLVTNEAQIEGELETTGVQRALKNVDTEGALLQAAGMAKRPVPKAPAAEAPKIGRNDPCPCGSGKKYKKCHGQAE